MHRLGRQKKLYLSYARTAIIAILFLFVAIPFVNRVANGGKTYTPEDRYMVVLNGEELGCVSDITIAQEALKDARTQINASNKGFALVETDIKLYKETAGGAVVSKEALSESIFTTLMSATVDSDSYETAYTVRIDDFTVTLASKEEVVELFEKVKDKYSNSNEFTVELIENSDGSYTSLVTNFVSADVTINEAAQVLATLNGDKNIQINKDEIVYKDGVLSVEFVESVEVIETRASSENIITVDEAYELITKEHAEKGTYIVQRGDSLSKIAEAHGLTLDELLALNEGMTKSTTIYVGEAIVVTVPAAEITVVVVEEMSYDEDYNAPIRYVDDKTMYSGTEKVLKKGTAGHRSVVALVSYVNGVESGREIISQTIHKEATETVIARGTLTPPTYIRPVNCYKINSAFGYRDHPLTHQWALHTGVDFGVTTGTPVKASASGTVIRASWYSSYGYCVDIRHSDGSMTRYAHLNSIVVSYGQSVRQGQLIAYSGASGGVSGAHLHFELWKGGKLVDPMKYIGN